MTEKLVVYDSFFGNTKKIAQAIAEAIGGTAIKVSDVSHEDFAGLKILFAGSPTRAFRPTPAMTSWLQRLRGELSDVKGSVFDTRFPYESTESGFLKFLIRIFGYANSKLEKAMKKACVEIALTPNAFGVTATEGPLIEGELNRAVAWARGIF